MAAGEDKHVYGFNKQDAQALIQGIGGNGKSPQLALNQLANGFICKTPSGGIPKKVGSTVTFVDCDCYYLAGTGSTRTVTAAGFKVPVGNYSTTSDIAADRDILPTMHGGALLANWEDCDDA
jgi:hypothetical protein